jgi:hypothetical protein
MLANWAFYYFIADVRVGSESVVPQYPRYVRFPSHRQQMVDAAALHVRTMSGELVFEPNTAACRPHLDKQSTNLV